MNAPPCTRTDRESEKLAPKAKPHDRARLVENRGEGRVADHGDAGRIGGNLGGDGITGEKLVFIRRPMIPEVQLYLAPGVAKSRAGCCPKRQLVIEPGFGVAERKITFAPGGVEYRLRERHHALPADPETGGRDQRAQRERGGDIPLPADCQHKMLHAAVGHVRPQRGDDAIRQHQSVTDGLVLVEVGDCRIRPPLPPAASAKGGTPH